MEQGGVSWPKQAMNQRTPAPVRGWSSLRLAGSFYASTPYNPPSAPLESEHVHPFQESGAEVISGSLRFRVGGEERSVKAGESITIPVDTPHHFWNDGEEVAHSVQWFKPALKIDRFFETYLLSPKTAS